MASKPISTATTLCLASSGWERTVPWSSWVSMLSDDILVPQGRTEMRIAHGNQRAFAQPPGDRSQKETADAHHGREGHPRHGRAHLQAWHHQPVHLDRPAQEDDHRGGDQWTGAPLRLPPKEDEEGENEGGEDHRQRRAGPAALPTLEVPEGLLGDVGVPDQEVLAEGDVG